MMEVKRWRRSNTLRYHTPHLDLFLFPICKLSPLCLASTPETQDEAESTRPELDFIGCKIPRPSMIFQMHDENEAEGRIAPFELRHIDSQKMKDFNLEWVLKAFFSFFLFFSSAFPCSCYLLSPFAFYHHCYSCYNGRVECSIAARGGGSQCLQ